MEFNNAPKVDFSTNGPNGRLLLIVKMYICATILPNSRFVFIDTPKKFLSFENDANALQTLFT